MLRARQFSTRKDHPFEDKEERESKTCGRGPIGAYAFKRVLHQMPTPFTELRLQISNLISHMSSRREYGYSPTEFCCQQLVVKFRT